MYTLSLVPILVFIAFLLLLLVSLSVPIIKTIYLFRLSANATSSVFSGSVTGTAKFGVWGYCISALDVSCVLTLLSTARAHLGYTFDSTVANALHATEVENLISRTTTAALVLHPIACGLAFLTLLTSLFILRRGSNGTARLPSLLTVIVGNLAAVLTTLVFLIDVIFVAVARKRVHNASHGELDLVWGNAVWMTLGATLSLWFAMIGACCGVFAFGRRSV
ncbi:hypothetical protein CVT26_006899 [Gymnopilus dilepis]|uniref:Pali-domain-containing protein n=1 Tax=Gymnopilus dilepis TaxID=231916 RepID=A0A409W102_9AGAR|nr:hypothetical protein CVT26_006899 [Gymnopilus dilepis]